MLIYDRNFRFYLSNSSKEYKDVIEEVFKNSEENGVMEELVRKHWQETFDRLNYDKRITMKLKNTKIDLNIN
ncbi:MAG: hypothetical protein ACQERZ_07355 [Fusobacteriota bacterium]